MMKGKLFLDIHALQVVPPSCLNRDDTGAPKTAIFGGVQRARVSSQSWKRAIRTGFRDGLDKNELSYRTRQVEELIKAKLMAILPDVSEESAAALVKEALITMKLVDDKSKNASKSKKNKKNTGADTAEEATEEVANAGQKKVMFFISTFQMQDIASIIARTVAEGKKLATVKKELKDALNKKNGIEIALFGRMSAADAEFSVDACVQVSHAISTHEVENEVDFFTAVDDVDTEGAGHLGDSEFNSSTLYRYATVEVHSLNEYVGDTEKTAKIVRDFIKQFVVSMPTGKINSYANNTIPSVLYVTLREDKPLNLSPAFERAIPASTEGFVVPSAKALEEYALDAYGDFSMPPIKSFVVGKYLPKLEGQGGRVNLSTLLDSVEDYIRGLE